MTFARRVFLVAGIYGLIALTPQYFCETWFGRLSPPPITHPEFFYGFLGVAVAWQWLFLVISRDPQRYRPAMPPAMLEKFSFGIAAIVLFAQHRLSLQMLLAGLGDLTFGFLFLIAFLTTKDQAAEESAGPK